MRKGTKLPYHTHPANVAIILTRYGRDNATVVAGILHDVIEDCVRDGYTREMLEQRIGDKFGAKVLETVLAVTYRRQDDDGVEFSQDERRADYLERLATASEDAPRARSREFADPVPANATTADNAVYAAYKQKGMLVPPERPARMIANLCTARASEINGRVLEAPEAEALLAR